ncbi:MAG TPA: hypothetical protein VE995_04635 [Gaiellaceae bacterium]|nr:hypothetical protein [Gaiellaceae bacterium]
MNRLLPIPLVLLAASCGSGPDPSATGGDAEGVLVATANGGGGCCGYVSGVALRHGHVFAAYGTMVAQVDFAPSTVQPSSWQPQQAGSLLDVEIAAPAGDGTLWWTATDGGGSSCAVWTSTEATFASPAAPAGTLCGGASAGTGMVSPGGGGPQAVVGLVADTAALYAAIATGNGGGTGGGSASGLSPDSQQWPGSGPEVSASGSIVRLDRTALSQPQALQVTGGVRFDVGNSVHVLAQSSTNVYWLDATAVAPNLGRVMQASKASWTAGQGQRLADVPSMAGQARALVGIAANDAYVAWAAAPMPGPGQSGCWVWAAGADGTARRIYDGPQGPQQPMCHGLAVDAQFAYFAIVTVVSQTNDPQGNWLMGTGIGRVPLAGGPAQTVSLQSGRWYGPRRVLVDEQYVYAIDPSYVVRVPKSAFGG